MATRYSGNVELRIHLQRMRGWDGRMGWFYVATVRAPNHAGEGVLSPREAGVRGTVLDSPEAYDNAARAFLTFANRKTKGYVGRQANREGTGWEILRVQQSPCPVEEELETRPYAARQRKKRTR